ncbi:MAG: HEAT repeat domain-containing protein [Myxococcota bacterium]
MGPELLELIIPTLIPLAGATVALFAYRAGRARLNAVRGACEALGLAQVKDPALAYRGEGEVGGVAVTVTMTPLTVSATLPWAVSEPVVVQPTMRKRARVPGAQATGDAAFDADVQLGGGEAVIAVLAAPESRAWVRRMLATKRQYVQDGRLRRHDFWAPKTVAGAQRFIEEVARLAAEAPRLTPQNTTRQALLQRASDARDPEVASHFIRRLLAVHGKTAEGLAASRLALKHADPELRLLAAGRLAGDGMDTLLALARDGELEPGLRARAVAAASASSCWPLALDTLHGLLAAGEAEAVVAAAAEGLGLVREEAALPALRGLLADESAAVRQAALRAIERIDHGSLDSVAGALAVAGAGAGVDGALEVATAGGEVALSGGGGAGAGLGASSGARVDD